MARTLSSNEPSRFRAGDSWMWDKGDLSTWPISEGWTIKYYLVGERATIEIGQNAGEITVVGTTHEVRFLAAKTRGIPPGSYVFSLRVIGAGAWAGQDDTVWTRRIEVLADTAEAGEGDVGSFDERMLAAIRARLYARVNEHELIETYADVGRSVNKMPTFELAKMEGIYAGRVRKAKHGGVGREVKTRLV